MPCGPAQELHPGRLKDLKFPVEIGLANEEGFPHAGILDFADNKIDRSTGTLRVRGVFENEKEYLTPGLVRPRADSLRRPAPGAAGHRAGDWHRTRSRNILLTVNKENEVEHRQVKLGRLRDGLRVIESGIGPDDLVIVDGLQRARPGTVVRRTRESA